MKILDLYIIRKFLSTFFFAIALIIAIAVVFDISEKIDDFLDKQAPIKAIVFDYYFNFIPFFANLFSPMFVFIAVIFFTSRMANNTEIVAILGSGISFKRFLLPYMIAATVIASLSFYFNNYVIPHSTKTRLEFENRYIKNPFKYVYRNIHRQISPGNFVYFESFNNTENTGYRFSHEKFKDGKLFYKLMAEHITWDSIKTKWCVENYFIREINGMNEKISTGDKFDTLYSFRPEEFRRRDNNIETMDTPDLKKFINDEKARGVENTTFMDVNRYRRTSLPFATFILTIIGVSLSSRKIRGGIGMQLGAGILLSFTYIMFMQISQTFAINASFSPLVAVWVPNIVFGIVAVFLYRNSVK
ncbi:MAG: LptF/LptG family permease [Bacteroidia bacterium]